MGRRFLTSEAPLYVHGVEYALEPVDPPSSMTATQRLENELIPPEKNRVSSNGSPGPEPCDR